MKGLKMLTSLQTKDEQQKYISILTALNSVVITTGLCIAGCGMVLKFGGEVVTGRVESFIDGITARLRSAGLDDFYLSKVDLVEMLQRLSIPLIVFGAVNITLSSFVIHIARRKITLLLIPYAGFITIVFILQGASVIVLFVNRKLIDNYLKSYLLTNLQEQYRGYNETNLQSQTWNIVMVSMQCCGVNDYTDFGKASQWRRKLFQDGWWFELQTPLTCCNMEEKAPGDFACAVNPTDQTCYMQGCYSTFSTHFDSNRGVILAGNAFLMLVQLILVIASVVLVRQVRKKSKKGAEEASQADDCEEINTNASAHTLSNGLLNHLSFLGFNGQNDPFQQLQNGGKRYSVAPEILTHLLSGNRRFSQMPSCDFDVRQQRMHSFDFGVPYQHPMPAFDYGGSSSRIQPFKFGVPQGPIIVQLPAETSTQNSPLKAITEAPNVEIRESEAIVDASTTPQIIEVKNDVPKFERCKSENCINLRNKDRNSQRLVESTKPELNRRKTISNGLQTKP